MELDLTLKKKKKKKKTRAAEFELEEGDPEAEAEAAAEVGPGTKQFSWSGTDREYTYDELLGEWSAAGLGEELRAPSWG